MSISTIPRPSRVYFSIRAEDGGAVVWLRIDGGPMQTAYRGETLRFGPLIGRLRQADRAPRPSPRRARRP